MQVKEIIGWNTEKNGGVPQILFELWLFDKSSKWIQQCFQKKQRQQMLKIEKLWLIGIFLSIYLSIGPVGLPVGLPV